MKIKSSMTIRDLHAVADKLANADTPASIDDLLVAIADAAAERAIKDLIDVDFFEEF